MCTVNDELIAKLYLNAIKSKQRPDCYYKDVDYDGMLVAQRQAGDQRQLTEFLFSQSTVSTLLHTVL